MDIKALTCTSTGNVLHNKQQTYNQWYTGTNSKMSPEWIGWLKFLKFNMIKFDYWLIILTKFDKIDLSSLNKITCILHAENKSYDDMKTTVV